MSKIFCHTGVFVIPSYDEGLPIVLLEALSYGLSCMASGIPAHRNVELSEERFFEVGNIDALAGKLLLFIDKPMSETEQIQQIEGISRNYDWDHIADKTMKIYRSFCSIS